MEHAKKYVLVDPLMYRPTLSEKSLSTLDREIHATLNSQLPDDEKAKLYMSVLNRFKAHDKKPQPPKLNLGDELTGALPPNQQYKAKKLVRLIKDNPDIDWSDKGELIYKQSLVPKSHVSDLFGDIFATQKPVDAPIGWEAFDEGVKEFPLIKRRLPKRKRGRPSWTTKLKFTLTRR